MDYSVIEALSDEEVLNMYDDILESDFISAGCIWRIDCDNGTEQYVCWGNCGTLPVGTKHYCYAYSCGNYSYLRVCNGGTGYEYLVKYDRSCDNNPFIRR